jgi:RHS repeat-associated protein
MTLLVNNKNQVTSPAFTYDAAGNTTWDTTNALKYDAEGRMNPVSGLVYTYDGDGRRVQKSDGTVYWVDDSLRPLSVGTNTGSITRDYVFFAGKRIATVPLSSGNAYYYLSDQINSTAVIASGDGKSIQWEADYFPFGSERTVITSLIDNHYQFTGDEYDSETAYNYAVARYQAGRWGRFLSPDLMGGSVMNPQSLNRYAYVLNNPCVLIDPLGLTPLCTITVSGGSNLDPKVKDEINRILDQANVTANFVDGANGDISLAQNATGDQMDRADGYGYTPPLWGNTSYINNTAITKAFDTVSASPTGYPFPNFNVGLGRIIAHELGHDLGLVDINGPDNLMGQKRDDQDFNPNGGTIFQLTDAQKSRILQTCKNFAKQNPGGGSGRGNDPTPIPLVDPGDIFDMLNSYFGDPHVSVTTTIFYVTVDFGPPSEDDPE